MKRLKSVTICGKTYRVTYNKQHENGRGWVFSQEIDVGTKSQKPERIFDTLLHEIAELVACEENFRYGDGHSETSVFVMSHKEFEKLMSMIAAAIYPMVKKEKG